MFECSTFEITQGLKKFFNIKEKEKKLIPCRVGKTTITLHCTGTVFTVKFTGRAENCGPGAFSDGEDVIFSSTSKEYARKYIQESGTVGFFELDDDSYINANMINSITLEHEDYIIEV